MDNKKKTVLKPSLTKEESTELTRCEAIIEAGLKTFLEVGRALEIIRSAALYRLTHSNFNSYVKDRFDLSPTRTYALINAAKVADGLPGEKLNSAQATALGKVDPAKRKGVLNRAKRTARQNGKKVTTRDIQNASGVHKVYTLQDFSKELGGLVNKAKAEGISLVQITDTIGAIHGQLVKMIKDAQKLNGPKSA